MVETFLFLLFKESKTFSYFLSKNSLHLNNNNYFILLSFLDMNIIDFRFLDSELRSRSIGSH